MCPQNPQLLELDWSLLREHLLSIQMFHRYWVYQAGFPDSSVGKESTCNAGDTTSIPGSGRSTREGIGYLLQYSWASLVAQLVKNLPEIGRPGFYHWVGKIPWRRETLPTPVFWNESNMTG